ncbi:MAG: hypothetical protein COX80_02305 [Candidatus Magasanikbacteria bacterium CG_4_10_14_0_2_um_filter_33_14]|uniref:Glycosyl transferase family 28 C-terminal domain-containing protein n=1 Tax=Candidatus Magasanikbacteria bacterium CG_4_10_14_0_2_um_filter_33_14 TaxID=1974636 RepID=A0A2M7VB07_9BACT|nr:MAG: hypothetical protein COX80_02305 [Candidatus Magasanikbacteria bacterium CG_4_10_14_0_2_um_filter_33_14]
MSTKNNFDKAYIVTVDMGYGHQRAVYPLHEMAQVVPGITMDSYGIINANKYGGITKSDQFKWEGGRKIYEKISRLKHLPLIGNYIFAIMDYLQRIEPFYPYRDLSKPTLQVKQIFKMIKKGWGKDLIDKLNRLEHLPYITSFFTTAFFAEEHDYKGDIYCICTDTDISRAWAPLEPKRSRINYLVPNRRVKERLMSYGIREHKISITGFPLPKENIGGKDLDVLKKNLANRIINLDPEGRYRSKYKYTIDKFLGTKVCSKNAKSDHPLTITFAVGGAGAQRELGAEIASSLRDKIIKGEIRLNLVAGVKNDVFRYYQAILQDLNLSSHINKNIFLIYSGESKFDYFKQFNEILQTTDILWTKPSELSFYAGLGMPVIIAPTIGSQEEFNKKWLISVGAGVLQEDQRYTNEWLEDWLASGWLAQAAMNGFLNAPRHGAHHIEEIVLKGEKSEIEDMHLF